MGLRLRKYAARLRKQAPALHNMFVAAKEPSVNAPERRVKFSTPYASIVFRLHSEPRVLVYAGWRPLLRGPPAPIDPATLSAADHIWRRAGLAQSGFADSRVYPGDQDPVLAASPPCSTMAVACQVIHAEELHRLNSVQI